MEILGDVKNYDWGKLGMDSEVSKLATLNDSSFVFGAGVSYSELWMGNLNCVVLNFAPRRNQLI